MSAVRLVLGERGDDGCRIALGRQVLAIAADAGISKFAPHWNASLSVGMTAITMTVLTDVSCPTG